MSHFGPAHADIAGQKTLEETGETGMTQECDQTADKTQGSAGEDDTLDIVRLLIETEARYEKVHSAAQKGETGAGNQPLGARVSPRRVTLRGKPVDTRGAAVPEDLTSDISEAPELEDLRPRRFGLRLPRIAFPRLCRPTLQRRARQKTAGGQASNRAKSLQQYAQYAKLAALSGLAVLILFKPWLIPLMLFVLAWLSLVAFLLLGSARISELAEGVWMFYRSRRPERAQRVLARLQRAADSVDGVLARLPAKWVDGVFTPDLGRSELAREEADIELPRDDPFERLARQGTPAE